MYDEGLVRFATHDYVEIGDDGEGKKGAAKRAKRLAKDRFMHLTNYSVNKKGKDYERASSMGNDAEGSKWSLTALWRHFEQRGVDTTSIKAQIDDIVVKALIAAEPKVVGRLNSGRVPRGRIFELGMTSCSTRG